MPTSELTPCPQCGTPAETFRAGVCPRCALQREVLGTEPELEPGAVPGYRLREKIGEGGMGEVFLAEQVKPMPREVALKRLKHAADGKDWLRRFAHELEALALLDHPDVASVYDSGVADDGRPFYTMELVDGLPITVFCDRERLSTAARLRLMARVCMAVDYAHRRGVWHGDLKPSNILAACITARAEPQLKLIDFGVRRASLTGGAHPAALFTPGYASPESRAAGGWDSRSDVYSLGIVLGEVLAGRPPESAGTLSEWFAQSPLAVELAAKRATTPRVVLRCLRSDADWIAARATASDPAARYSSAADMAADIERMLEGRAVQAHPASVRYVAGKFLRRHRRPLMLWGAALLILTVTAMGTLLHYATTRNMSDAMRQTQRETMQAMQRAGMMRELVHGVAMLARAPDRTMRDAGLPAVLQRAAQSAERAGAEGDPVSAATLLHAAAAAANVMDRPDLALPHWRRALHWLDQAGVPGHLPQRTGMEAAMASGLMHAGNTQEALAILSRLTAEDSLAALPPHARLEVLMDSARAHFAVRDFSAAASCAERALAGAEQAFGKEEPPVLHCALLLGQALTELRRYKEARTSLARAAAGLPPDSPPAKEAAQLLAEVEKVLEDMEEK